MQRVERFIEIGAPVEQVFELFSDFESFPRWMRNVRDVRRTGRRTTHWVCETALDIDIEWEAELTVYEPDHRIVWRSFRGDVHTDGEAIFTETAHGTTLLHMVLGYDTPSGRSEGDALARFFGRNPERQLAEDLARFRRLIEQAGERLPRAYGGGGRDERRPPARAQREGRAQRQRDEFEDGRGDFRDGDRRAGDDFARRDFEETDYERRERIARSERRSERERRFEEALRDARRSQIEGMRRYAREREDEERQRRGRDATDYRRDAELRARQRRGFDDEGDFEDGGRGRENRERGRGGQDEYRPRYPLTPRERERERRPQERNDGASFDFERLRRRGIERLLEDPPSNRFGRGRRERE